MYFRQNPQMTLGQRMTLGDQIASGKVRSDACESFCAIYNALTPLSELHKLLCKQTCCATKNATFSARTRYLLFDLKMPIVEKSVCFIKLNALKIDFNVNNYHVIK